MSDRMNIPRFGAWGLEGPAVMVPSDRELEDMTPKERKAGGLPAGGDLHHQVTFDSMGTSRKRPAVTRGNFQSHPFLEALEVSSSRGIRFHGAPTGTLIASGKLAGVELVKLNHAQGRPKLTSDLQVRCNLLLLERRRDLTLATTPVDILWHETFAEDRPRRPTQGGEDHGGPISVRRWLTEAVEQPLDTPEDWPLRYRLTGWVIALRGRAWNWWRASLDNPSTT